MSSNQSLFAAEALAVLMAPDAWPKLVDAAVAAVTWRSREPAG